MKNQEKRPNILFLMSDQHRADFVGYEGHVVKTPTLNWLAETGAVFEHAYTPSPVCLPGRQCMMAGKYPSKCGARRYGEDLTPGYMTFSRRLSQYAYTTVCAGKMHHVGSDQMQGWTHRLGWWDMEVYDHYIEGAVQEEFDKYPKPVPFWSVEKEIKMAGPGESTYAKHDQYTVEGTIQFIKEYFCDGVYDKHHPNRPVCLKVSLQQPHYPYIGDAEKYTYYLNRVKPFHKKDTLDHPLFGEDWTKRTMGEEVTEREVTRALAAYCAMIESCDEQYKKILDTLEYVGQDLDDWIIIYTSDHGDMMGEYDLWWKLKFLEGSVRVPLIIRAPQYTKGGQRIHENVNLVDLFATLCDIAAIPVPSDVDSRSLLPLLQGRMGEWKNETISQFYSGSLDEYCMMIKQDDLKYMYFGKKAKEVLIDLAKNPEENINHMETPSYQQEVENFRKRVLELRKQISYQNIHEEA